VKTTPHPKRGKTGGGSAGPASSGMRWIATHLLDLPGWAIALLYRCRWAIENFFRFWKHVLGCRHRLGRRGRTAGAHCETAIPADLGPRHVATPTGRFTLRGRRVEDRDDPPRPPFADPPSIASTLPLPRVTAPATIEPNRIGAVRLARADSCIGCRSDPGKGLNQAQDKTWGQKRGELSGGVLQDVAAGREPEHDVLTSADDCQVRSQSRNEKGQPVTATAGPERRRPDSNRGWRICNALGLSKDGLKSVQTQQGEATGEVTFAPVFLRRN